MPEFGVSNAQRSYAKEILLCAKSWKMHDFAKAFKEKNSKTFEPPGAPKRRLEEKKATTPDAKRQKLNVEKKHRESQFSGSNPRTPERRHMREKNVSCSSTLCIVNGILRSLRRSRISRKKKNAMQWRVKHRSPQMTEVPFRSLILGRLRGTWQYFGETIRHLERIMYEDDRVECHILGWN